MKSLRAFSLGKMPICGARWWAVVVCWSKNGQKFGLRDFPDTALDSGRFSGGMIAEPNKVEIYRLLFRLNRAFAFVVEQLTELEPMRIIALKYLRNFKGYTQELQAEINQELLESLHGTELEDWARFGKVRQAVPRVLNR